MSMPTNPTLIQTAPRRSARPTPPPIMLALLSLLIGLLATLLGPAAPAGACSCIGIDEALEMQDAAVVFTGTVIDEEPKGEVFGADGVSLLFDVDQVFKGSPGGQVLVDTPAGGSAGCGVSDRGPMVVLAYSDGESLSTSLCSTASESAEITRTLTAIYGPSTEAAPATTRDINGGGGFPVAAGIGIALFAIALLGGVAAVARPGKEP